MEQERLSEFELTRIKEAFEIIDSIVDKDTKSKLLQEIWSKFADLLEENGIEVGLR